MASMTQVPDPAADSASCAGGHRHHAFDVAAGLLEAERVCTAAGESLTPLRRDVMELLLRAHGPAKAYDLLQALTAGAAKPPTIYRALEFLQRMGLAHRIESLNAFIACGIGACAKNAGFLICTACGWAEELLADPVNAALEGAASERGFRIAGAVIEARGLCRDCAPSVATK